MMGEKEHFMRLREMAMRETRGTASLENPLGEYDAVVAQGEMIDQDRCPVCGEDGIHAECERTLDGPRYKPQGREVELHPSHTPQSALFDRPAVAGMVQAPASSPWLTSLPEAGIMSLEALVAVESSSLAHDHSEVRMEDQSDPIPEVHFSFASVVPLEVPEVHIEHPGVHEAPELPNPDVAVAEAAHDCIAEEVVERNVARVSGHTLPARSTWWIWFVIFLGLVCGFCTPAAGHSSGDVSPFLDLDGPAWIETGVVSFSGSLLPCSFQVESFWSPPSSGRSSLSFARDETSVGLSLWYDDSGEVVRVPFPSARICLDGFLPSGALGRVGAMDTGWADALGTYHFRVRRRHVVLHEPRYLSSQFWWSRVSCESVWWSGKLMGLSPLLVLHSLGVSVWTEFWCGVIAEALGSLAVDQLRILLASL
jgi:hypothetical protein